MIDKLELLLALAKERHFGRAAEACGVTQPTMSTSLKQLEEILGVMLVQRGSRFQGFTPEGERTLDWARRIVGDARAMRQEINTLKDGLSGEIGIAAIPTALGMVASLTTPFRARHPNVRFRIVSCTSIAVLGLLENLEVDAGLTYLENEPLGKVRSIPLYNENYVLLTSPDSMFGDREQVTWKEVGQVPLCLLTPDMQNRRIIDRALKSVGAEATPTLTSNSIIVLYTHVRTGRWASVMPARLAQTLGLSDAVRTHPDCRSHCDLQRRAGGSAARPPDAADRSTDANRARSRADAGALSVLVQVGRCSTASGLSKVRRPFFRPNRGCASSHTASMLLLQSSATRSAGVRRRCRNRCG